MKKWILSSALAALLLAACSGNQNHEYAPNDAAELTDSTSVTGLTGEEVKLVRSARLHLKVAEVGQGAQALSGLARSMGGAVFYQRIHAEEAERRVLRLSPDSLTEITAVHPVAEVTIRIPHQHLDSFAASAMALGYHTYNSELTIDDQSLQHLEHRLRAEVREEAAKPGVKGKDEAISHTVAAMSIDAAARYSTVEFRLTQNPLVRRERIADTGLEALNEPYGQRLSAALAAGWAWLGELLLLLTSLWPLLLIGGMVLSGYRLYKRA